MVRAKLNRAEVEAIRATDPAVNDAAAALGVEPGTLRKWAKRWEIEPFRSGRFEVDEAEFKRLYNLGRTPAQIAEALGIEVESVRGVRRRLDLPPFQRSIPNPTKEPGRERVADAQARDLTVVEAAAELGLHPTTLNKWRRHYGIAKFKAPPRTATPHNKYDREEMATLLRQHNGSPKAVADIMGCSEETVGRFKRSLNQTIPKRVYTQADKDAAEALLDEEVSYRDIERTLGIPARRVARWFPGRGWTAAEGSRYGRMLQKLDAL
jgi:transposase-like protein